ncbi:MAG: response regulator transcription factor [Rhodospirillum sp.]|nr:response regulator transcription factor [Rhodospirillum sp.]MCF8488289.1 response regulator transcription factor [Rhodospirillum sp.]MCF8500055.1 response regulator transcription factor [Rhodospirillum sp.]
MSLRKRILVVEDDPATREMIAAYLSTAGFDVLSAESGRAMAATLKTSGRMDLLLLDVNLPDSDGMMLAHEIRRRSPLGIIIVSERDTPNDRAMGLEMGADDYITKPFFPRELLARVRNVLDRAGPAGEARGVHGGAGRVMRVGNWLIDKENRKIVDEASGQAAPLTPAEFDVLAVLVEHPGQLMDRDAIAESIGEKRSEGGGRKVDILISRLRRKLGDGTESGARMIETVRGHGYRFAALVDWV